MPAPLVPPVAPASGRKSGRKSSPARSGARRSSPRRASAAAAAAPPVDVFMALNQDGDDVMSMEEFQRLFELLELDLKEEQKEQLFAYDGTRLGRGASHARTAP